MQNSKPELLPKPRLLITSPKFGYQDDGVCQVLLEKDTITLGEADSNDIVLSRDYMTAPHHALLKKQDGSYHLFERCCKGGVFINGRKLVSGLGYKLTDGDQIAIGQYRLIFSSTPTQKLTLPKPMASASVSQKVTLPKMLTLPAKRNS